MKRPASIQVFLHRLRALGRDDSGVVMLETVLVFPIQLLLTMLIIQFAHIYTTSHVVHYAAFQSARSMVLNAGRMSETENLEQAEKIAWVICSSVNNEAPRSPSLRVPDNTYYYQTQTEVADSGNDPLTIAYALESASSSSSGSSGSSLPIHNAQVVVAVKVSYWLDLRVPLAGPFVYHALDAAGSQTIRVRSDNKRGQLLVNQIARIPKPWPF